MTRVYLIRHGATALNREVPYRIQGRRTDAPIDSTGIEQARRAGAVLAGARLDAVYASPLLRALETSRLVGGPHGLEPVGVPDLIEADVGRWEGLTWDEARALDPGPCADFLARPGTVPYPEGESFQDVRRRAAPAVAALAAAHPGGRIAIVSHNVVNRACLADWLGVPIDRARALRQSNGGINVVDFDGGSIRVETLNACFHLEGLADP